jgi:diguanylate cyclase
VRSDELSSSEKPPVPTPEDERSDGRRAGDEGGGCLPAQDNRRLVEQLLAEAQTRHDAYEDVAAATAARRAMALARTLDDAGLQIRSEVMATLVAMRADDNLNGARHASRAMTLAQSLGDPVMLARARLASALVSRAVGDIDRALEELERAMPVAEESDDRSFRFDCQNLLGVAFAELNDLPMARAWLERALETAKAAELRHCEVTVSGNLARVSLALAHEAVKAGQPFVARERYLRAVAANEDVLKMAERYDTQRGRFSAVVSRSEALANLGRFDEARTGYDEASALLSKAGDSTGHVTLSLGVARLQRDEGDLDRALTTAEHAIVHGEMNGLKGPLAPLLELVAELAEQSGDLRGALKRYKRFHAIRDEVALGQAQARSQVMAVRLDTQRALAEVAVEREKSARLTEANRDLRARAESLSVEAHQDPLTGLANRRRLDSYLRTAHAEAVGRNLPLCVAMMDIDDFKGINDRYSHAVGDQVLREVARLLRTQCREDDLPARFGGEEFVLVISNVGPWRAAGVCERFRRAVEAFDWASVAEGLQVTISVGVCDIAESATAGEGLGRADALMYEAKAAGRNRVVPNDETPSLVVEPDPVLPVA